MREYALHSEIDLRSVLTPQDAAAIAGIGVRREFKMGSILQEQDQPAHCLHLLLSGSVKTSLLHADGQESVLRIHLPGSLIGLSTLTSRGRCDASSVALCDLTASCIKPDDFLDLMRKQPSLSIMLVHLLVDRLSDLHFRMTELQTQSVQHRLAYALLSLSRPDPHASGEPTVRVELTHQELAQLISTRRQTVTTILSRFARAGWIARSAKSIQVRDRSALAQICRT